MALADGGKVEAPMNYSSRSERLILANPMDPRLRRNVTEWDRIVAALTGPELVALAMFCALGLVATVALCFLVPNFGDLASSLQPLG
jgi:hypothetical protein